MIIEYLSHFYCEQHSGVLCTHCSTSVYILCLVFLCNIYICTTLYVLYITCRSERCFSLLFTAVRSRPSILPSTTNLDLNQKI